MAWDRFMWTHRLQCYECCLHAEDIFFISHRTHCFCLYSFHHQEWKPHIPYFSKATIACSSIIIQVIVSSLPCVLDDSRTIFWRTVICSCLNIHSDFIPGRLESCCQGCRCVCKDTSVRCGNAICDLEWLLQHSVTRWLPGGVGMIPVTKETLAGF